MGVDLSNKINMKMLILEATSCTFEVSPYSAPKKKNRDGFSQELKENQSTRDSFIRNKSNHSENRLLKKESYGAF